MKLLGTKSIAISILIFAVSVALPANGKTYKIGLALSGGGFRAAGFHLGVLRELEQKHLLEEVDVISCVSGGCIAAGVLVHRWKKPDRLDKLEDFLTRSKNIEFETIFGGILTPGKTRIDKLAKAYDKALFDGATLADLRSGPRIYINATNVANGTRFFFASGGAPSIPGMWDDVIYRDQTIEKCDAPNFPVAKALAASSSFPPIYNPLRLQNRCLKDRGLNFVSLTDGGVYDNVGLGPFIYDLNRWAEQLDFVIVSDGGKPFAIDEKPTTSGPGVAAMMHNIQMANIRGLGLQLLLDRYCAGKGPRPIFFSIDSAVGEAMTGDATFASGIGTRLKGLSNREITILKRHGAALLDDRLSKYAPDIAGISSQYQDICQGIFAQGDIGGLFPWD